MGSRSASSMSSFAFKTFGLILLANGFFNVPGVVGKALSRFHRGFLEGVIMGVATGLVACVISFVLLAARVVRGGWGRVAGVLVREDERVVGVAVALVFLVDMGRFTKKFQDAFIERVT